MASASVRGSIPSSSSGRHSELSSWLLPPSSCSSNKVQRRRSVVTRLMSVVALLVALLTVGMIMWLERELQMTVANFEKQLADHKANLSANLVTDNAGASHRFHGATANETTTSVLTTSSTFRKPEISECQGSYGATRNENILYPNLLAVRSWIRPSGKLCDNANGGELVISEAGRYIVICQAVLSTVDNEGVVKGSTANNITRALTAQLTLYVRIDNKDELFKNVSSVVLHKSTYQLNTVVWLPAGARLAVLLTSFAGLKSTGNVSWEHVTIALSRLGGDRPSR